MSIINSSDQFLKAIIKDTQGLSLNLATKVFNGVVARSPVDTGAFKAAWSISGSSNEGDISFRFTESTGLETSDSEGNTSFDENTFPIISISNPKKYGPALENGHSKQAPNGIVAVTIASIT